MKFCMVTSFFGEHSFGGDSIYVERLSRALLRRGHEVSVAFCPGAFESVRKGTPLRMYDPPDGISLHPLNGGFSGMLDAVWSHQTCRSGRLRRKLSDLLENGGCDVIHFHNISLMGAADLLPLACNKSGTAVLLTLHDYWWLCPQSLFWKFGNRFCEAPDCTRCSLKRHVPPQVWRRKGWFEGLLEKADALFFPSASAAKAHESRGLVHGRTIVLPGLLPAGWVDPEPSGLHRERLRGKKPLIAAAGRLVREKGFQTLIPLMKHLPGLELLIAGGGPLKEELEELASGLDNVRFLGLLPEEGIRRLFLDSRAVVVPSLFPETFGLVAAEALSLNVPVIARRFGALPELVESAGRGLLFDTDQELLALLSESGTEGAPLEAEMGVPAVNPPDTWFEAGHIDKYLETIDAVRGRGRSARSK